MSQSECRRRRGRVTGVPQAAGPPLGEPLRGGGVLALLDDARALALMRALRRGPLGREQSVARVGFDGSAFDRSLRQLTRLGLVLAVAPPEDHRRRRYALAECGADLLAIDAELDRVLAGLPAHGDDLRTPAAKTISAPWDRAVARVLLEAPQPFNELLRAARGTWRPERGPRLSADRLTASLARLQRLGLVERRQAQSGAAAMYAPGGELWRFGRLAVLAALWRWRWTPAQVPPIAGDLCGLVRMLAPGVAVSLADCCVELSTDTQPGMGAPSRVVVYVVDGRVLPAETALSSPDAKAHATPRVWLEALLSDDFEAIAIDGETAPALALLPALAATLCI